MGQVAFLLVAKCFAVGDKKLKVTCVWLIDVWIINLIDDSVTEGEPETTTGMVGCADSFFRT